MPELPDQDAILAQFNSLIEELLGGGMRRSGFQVWEMDILLDIASCSLRESDWHRLLHQYQTAAQDHMAKGARTPLKLSEYLQMLEARPTRRKPAAAERSAGRLPKTGTR
jgi:hypothetical protein